MQRILITGNAGSGKTTAARRLATKLGTLPHHLDQIVWCSGWRKVELDRKNSNIERLTSGPKWIIDGVSTKAMDSADIILFIDLPRSRCLSRVIERAFRFGLRQRPEMPSGCPELHGLLKAIKITWRFQHNARLIILKKIGDFGNSKKIFHVKNVDQLDLVLEQIAELART